VDFDDSEFDPIVQNFFARLPCPRTMLLYASGDERRKRASNC
jgi:hypothetical protein